MTVTLLYIEDDHEIGSVVSADLSERGYSVRWLRSGRERRRKRRLVNWPFWM